MLNVTGTVNLGADPEKLMLGQREVYKLRCADKAPGKNSVTRWISVLVSGPDCDTASRLSKGDTILISGVLAKQEYKPKKPRFKGDMMATDDIPFGKILQVIKSDSFFNKEVGDYPGETNSGTTEANPTDVSLPGGGEVVDSGPDPLEGL